MEILEILNILMAIVAISSPIVYYIISKKVIKNQKEELFQEIPDKILAYLSTPEAQTNLRNVGIIMASGIAKQFGVDGSALKGKTFGIPNVVFIPFAQKLMAKLEDKAIKKESQDDSVSPLGES